MTAKKTLDLASLDTVAAANKGFELELVHPHTKEGLGQFITIVGSDSDQYKEYQNALTNARIKEQAINARTGKESPIRTVEQMYEEGTKLLAACTIGFRNIDYNGPLEFSQLNAVKLYTGLKFVRSQVDAAIADIGNFIKS